MTRQRSSSGSIMLRRLRRLRVTVIFYTCGSLCAILLLVNFNEDVKRLLQQSHYNSGPHDDLSGFEAHSETRRNEEHTSSKMGREVAFRPTGLFGSSSNTALDRPWFMWRGSRVPTVSANPANLWHDQNPKGDRIVEQLMYTVESAEDPVPINDPHTQDNSLLTNHLETDLVPSLGQPMQNASRERIKTILLYYGLGMSWGAQVTGGRQVFLQQKCPVNTCRLTGNRGTMGKADAVVFKDVFMHPKTRRPPNQLWLMYMLECPLNTQNFMDKSVFNMTATYRHDSDIVTPYEKWVYYDERVRSLPQGVNFAKGKSKKVAWFVSNCVAKNNRLEYARELGKYIDVDIYGACGTHSCSRANARQCFDLLSKHYKFYLAFENSNCRDYISEKFFVNGLGNKVLPIVMGAHPDDYKRVAPEKSYIHIDDFESPKDLAAHLHDLDKDDALYNEYFSWKGTGEFVNTHFFCRLCAMIHYAERESEPKPRYYEDFNNWWRGPNVCTRRSWRNQPDIFAPPQSDKQTTHDDIN